MSEDVQSVLGRNDCGWARSPHRLCESSHSRAARHVCRELLFNQRAPSAAPNEMAMNSATSPSPLVTISVNISPRRLFNRAVAHPFLHLLLDHG